MGIVKLNNQGVKNATAFGSITGLGSMTFIKKLTASGSSTLSFVDGASGVVLDDTYKEYVFTFNNIHQDTGEIRFECNFSSDGGSNYNVTKTTTYFQARHRENGTDTSLAYDTGADLAQSTSNQRLTAYSHLGNGADQSLAGNFNLFNPSSTTFVKHFIVSCQYSGASDYCINNYVAGYCNTTSAINAVRFSMSSGNLASGDICLYGIA